MFAFLILWPLSSRVCWFRLNDLSFKQKQCENTFFKYKRVRVKPIAPLTWLSDASKPKPSIWRRWSVFSDADGFSNGYSHIIMLVWGPEKKNQMGNQNGYNVFHITISSTLKSDSMTLMLNLWLHRQSFFNHKPSELWKTVWKSELRICFSKAWIIYHFFAHHLVFVFLFADILGSIVCRSYSHISHANLYAVNSNV